MISIQQLVLKLMSQDEQSHSETALIKVTKLKSTSQIQKIDGGPINEGAIASIVKSPHLKNPSRGDAGHSEKKIGEASQEPVVEHHAESKRFKRYRRIKKSSKVFHHLLAITRCLILAVRCRTDISKPWKELFRKTGLDSFPFRGRGWTVVFIFFFLLGGAFFLLNPTRWDSYRKWRSAEHFKRAVASLESGQLRAAEIHLRNAYRHTPENVEILKKWLDVIPQSEPGQRISILLQIHEMKPSGDSAAAVIEELLANRGYTDAANFAARQLTLFPESGLLWFASGKTYLIQRRFPAAEEALLRAKKLIPDNKSLDFHLALLRVLMTPADQSPDYSSLESFQNVPELKDVVNRTLAAIYIANDPNKAAKMVDKFATENPGEWDYQFLRFRMQMENSDDKQNFQHWDQIWSKSDTLQKRAVIILEAVRLNLTAIAERLFAMLSDNEREMPPGLWLQLLIHIKNEQWQLAISCAKSALEKYHLQPEWRIRLLAGIILAQQRLGYVQDFNFSYTEASRVAQGNPQISFFLSELLYELGLVELAKDSYERTAKMASPLTETALLRLLEINNSRKDWDSTLKTLDLLNQINPSNNNYISRLCSMLLMEQRVDHPMVRALLQNNLDNYPLHPEALEIVAHAAAQAGQLARAARIIKKIENSSIPFSSTSPHRVATLAYLGQKDQAIKFYNQILEQKLPLHQREKLYLEQLIKN